MKARDQLPPECALRQVRLRRHDWEIIQSGQIRREPVGFFVLEAIVTDENPNANTLLAVADTYLLRCYVRVCGVAVDDVMAAHETGVRENPRRNEEEAHAASANTV